MVFNWQHYMLYKKTEIPLVLLSSQQLQKPNRSLMVELVSRNREGHKGTPTGFRNNFDTSLFFKLKHLILVLWIKIKDIFLSVYSMIKPEQIRQIVKLSFQILFAFFSLFEEPGQQKRVYIWRSMWRRLTKGVDVKQYERQRGLSKRKH